MVLDGFQRELVALLPRLRRMARMITRHPADADDLTQIAIERALTHRGRWTPGTRLDSWMFRIMKNAWIDDRRRNARSQNLIVGDGAVDHAPDTSIASMETRLEASAAERALEALPEDQRLAVALVLVEGLSYKEAAEALEIPMGTLTSRLGRGRMALMAELQGTED